LPGLFVALGLAFAGCDGSEVADRSPEKDNGADAVLADVDDQGALACERSDTAGDFPGEPARLSLAPMSAEVTTTPFRCLRFVSAEEAQLSEEPMNTVDIRKVGADGQLQIPLHEIKTKAFLRNKPLAVVSDGKNFAALEKECNDIKASGVPEVVAVLPQVQDKSVGNRRFAEELPTIRPQEFVAERPFGRWHIVDLTSTGGLESPLFKNLESSKTLVDDMKLRGPVAGLARTLVVSDDGRMPDSPILGAMRASLGQVFLLEGGMKGFARFQADATAMARALERPRISERGCNG